MAETDRADASLTFGILGTFKAAYAGADLRLGGRQQRAILALLVCEAGHTVSVERSDPERVGRAGAGRGGHQRADLRVPPQTAARARPSAWVSGAHPGDGARGLPARGRSASASTWPASRTLVATGDAALEQREPDRAVAAYSAALALWRGEVLADLSDYDFVAPLRARLEEMRASGAPVPRPGRTRPGAPSGRRRRAGRPHRGPSPSRGLPRPAHPRAVPIGPAVGRAGRLPRAARSCWTRSSASSRARRCGSSTTGCSRRTRPWPGSPPASPAPPLPPPPRP